MNAWSSSWLCCSPRQTWTRQINKTGERNKRQSKDQRNVFMCMKNCSKISDNIKWHVYSGHPSFMRLNVCAWRETYFSRVQNHSLIFNRKHYFVLYIKPYTVHISLNGQHTNKWCLLQKGSSLSFKRSCFVGREKTEQLKRLTGGFSLSEWRSGGVE